MLIDQPTIAPSLLANFLKRSGRVASFEELELIVWEFEIVLRRFEVEIEVGSQLEAACLSVLEVFGKHKHPDLRSSNDDFRKLFGDVLGTWSLLKLTVQFQGHPTFPTFVPHLALLNEGAVVQNKRLCVTDEAGNKIFELLFALVLLSVGDRLVLDHPSLAQGDNPDILVTIDGKRWGFALKTLHSRSPKTFFDNLRKGIEQIEHSEAEIGCVLVNFRNLIDHELFLPILNPVEHAAGAEAIFGGYVDPMDLRDIIMRQVMSKENEVRQEVGDENIKNLFAGMKAIPGFAAFFQTCASKVTVAGPVPSDIISLGIGNFGDLQAYIPVFEKINLALHQRIASA